MPSFKTIPVGRRIRVVQAGCGEMAQAWVERALRIPELEIVALADVRREAAERTAARFNLPSKIVSDSLKTALKSSAPDVVFDVTVPAAHCQVTLEALKSGCHVLGEKPLSDSMACAKKMCSAARKSHRLFAVTQNRRYNEHAASFRVALKNGTIGELSSLDADFYLGAHFEGFRKDMPHVLLLDMAIHTFDQARMISGCDPAAVYCREYNPHGSWFKNHAAAVCVFEMTQGVTFTYRGSWASEGFSTSWESQWRASGSKGTVVWDGISRPRAQVAGGGGFQRETLDVEIPPTPMQHTGHEAALYDFINALRSGQEPRCVCHDNIKSLAMCFAAIESAAKGKRVKIKL